MRFYLLVTVCLLMAAFTHAAGEYEITSPNGTVRVIITTGNGIRYSVTHTNKLIIEPSVINMVLDGNRDLAGKLAVKKTGKTSVRNWIVSPVPEKRRNIPDHYNSIIIRFAKPFSLEFRAYDDGVAWRLLTHSNDSIRVQNETAEFKLHGNPSVSFTQVVKRDNIDRYHTSFEEPYETKPADSLGAGNLVFTPTLVSTTGPKLIITESDLEDYPGMFLTGDHSGSLLAEFAPYPAAFEVTPGEFPQAVVTGREKFIAHTKGSRTFPWRVILVAAEDKDLPANDLVYRLASPSRVADPSWIQPGKGTDEWIIGVNLFNVPFKSGVNTATYKYYIDFAKRFGFERIMMDAGWSDYKDLFKINPAINMDTIAAYARQQGIRLSMWTLAMTLDKQLEPALAQFNKWGVDFIMTDFMDRDDQPMVNFYHRIAKACADHKIMIMYHGAFKPAGFNRTWPNAITREGVLGSEYNIWSEKPTPEHNLMLPFIRMTSGPMDYEPGILDNATAKTFRPIGDKVMAPGTRCHQAAMFIVYESPIQLFSGNPSQGLMEPAFMEIVGDIPTVWDTTIVIDGKVGDYILTARKKGDTWYIGGMTDWTARELTLPLTFLGEDSYEATILEDGINADRYPSDYVIKKQTVSNKETLTVKMGPGGGVVLVIVNGE